MSNKIQLYDKGGNAAYPVINRDCITSFGEVPYVGRKIDLLGYKCNITEVGTLTPYAINRTVQGILYKDGELFQFYNGGRVDVYSINKILEGGTVECKRTFSIPNASSLHFGGVDWFDETNKVFITHCQDNNSLYKISIADESNIILQSVATPDIPSEVIAHGGIVGYDKLNKRVYLTGYIHADRSDTTSAKVGLALYSINPTTGVSALIREDIPGFHLQDCTFYNGLLYYANDSSTGDAGGYDVHRIMVIEPYVGIVAAITIPNLSAIEAEGICVVEGKYILETKTGTHKSIRVHKIEF